jgi:hypothetical protein
MVQKITRGRQPLAAPENVANCQSERAPGFVAGKRGGQEKEVLDLTGDVESQVGAKREHAPRRSVLFTQRMEDGRKSLARATCC